MTYVLTKIPQNSLMETLIMFFFQYFPSYGPSYELHIDPSLQKDQNNDYIVYLINQLKSYTKYIK